MTTYCMLYVLTQTATHASRMHFIVRVQGYVKSLIVSKLGAFYSKLWNGHNDLLIPVIIMVLENLSPDKTKSKTLYTCFYHIINHKHNYFEQLFSVGVFHSLCLICHPLSDLLTVKKRPQLLSKSPTDRLTLYWLPREAAVLITPLKNNILMI